MAQKRLLDRKISLSEKVAELDILGQLIYERMILHADDFGLMQASPRTIRAQTIPMVDTTSDEIARELTKMLEVGLLRKITYDGKEYFKIIDFGENQRLRRDMQPYTILPIKLGNKYEENWKKIYEIVESRNKPVTTSDEIATEDKLSKVKSIVTDVTSKMAVAISATDPINREIELFKDVNPNYERLYANKSQRSSLERMNKKHGEEKITRAIIYAVKVFGKRFAPRITTPIKLEEKMGDLIAYMKSQEADKPFIAVMPKEL